MTEAEEAVVADRGDTREQQEWEAASVMEDADIPVEEAEHTAPAGTAADMETWEAAFESM